MVCYKRTLLTMINIRASKNDLKKIKGSKGGQIKCESHTRCSQIDDEE